jgi:hypothetical protein
MPNFVKARQRPSGNELEVNLDAVGGGTTVSVDHTFTYQTPGILDPAVGAVFHTPNPGQWYAFMCVSIVEGFDGAANASVPNAKWYFYQKGASLPGSVLGQGNANSPDGTVGDSTVQMISGWDSSVRLFIDSTPLVVCLLDWDGNPLVNPTQGIGRIFGVLYG